MISEADIVARLRAALPADGTETDGYSELEITQDTRLKCAAVLIPLVQDGTEWHLLYTRRTNQVESHKGQVSFPGGACDEGETTPEETALREAEEEIGINPAGIRVLGRLASLITISAFRVTPVVGVLPWPAVFRLNVGEVERVFTLPLEWLADRGNRWEFAFPGRQRSLIAFHPFGGELLWGATARMTVDFLRVLGL
jgi:8-oxo-dGTP pyrophosphatase MutT (NUDIX family)